MKKTLGDLAVETIEKEKLDTNEVRLFVDDFYPDEVDEAIENLKSKGLNVIVETYDEFIKKYGYDPMAQAEWEKLPEEYQTKKEYNWFCKYFKNVRKLRKILFDCEQKNEEDVFESDKFNWDRVSQYLQGFGKLSKKIIDFFHNESINIFAINQKAKFIQMIDSALKQKELILIPR